MASAASGFLLGDGAMASAALGDDAMASAASGAASGASGFLLGDDAVEFMQERGEQTWEAANEAGGCEAVWLDDCAQCGDGGGLRACCGFCNHVFHPKCLDPPQDDVENWDEVAFACGLCVADAKAKPAITTQTQGARLMRQMRQRRATTAAAEARRAARDKDIRDEHDAIALFVEQRAGGAAAGKRAAASAPPDPRRAHSPRVTSASVLTSVLRNSSASRAHSAPSSAHGTFRLSERPRGAGREIVLVASGGTRQRRSEHAPSQGDG